ncbi:MAG: transcriptional regulator [Nitrospinae bacterium CG11_big_fil_rev_8_21_14_0_20_56_8]|nr:MAG: transcriptional regulator [Nitrospinae bacterium CG11_big_fil_rev_8_21_14_0_20_56_8]
MACSPDEVVKLANAGGEPVAGVPLLNIPATYHEILENLEQEWMEVVRSGHYILGPKVSLLEERIAAFCGTPHAVGVSSGTDALLIALMAAGIGEGDEVITTPYTFFATAGSIARLGARPVFVDIDPETFNLQPDSVERAINSKTRAVMPVHLYGQCADMDAINRAAKAHGLSVIEDACQAIGARYKGRRAGALSDYGCFSFFPTKNLGGLGDGGMVTLGDPELFEKVRILRVHGSEPKYYHKMIGGNFRIDAIQAAGILAKLPFLERWTEKRRTNAKLYDRLFRDRGLDGKVGLPPEKVAGHVYNQYVIRAGSHRDALRTYLQKNKVMTEIYYPVPLHLQECFRYLGYGKGDFPEAEKAASETLALPISHELTPPQQEHVVNAIADFYS